MTETSIPTGGDGTAAGADPLAPVVPASTSQTLEPADQVQADISDLKDRLTTVEAALKALQAVKPSSGAGIELVEFTVEDPLFSHDNAPVTVTGVGVIVRTLDDGVRIAPLTELQLSIPADGYKPHDPSALPPAGGDVPATV